LALHNQNAEVESVHFLWAQLTNSNSVISQLFNKMNIDKTAIELDIKSAANAFAKSSQLTKENIRLSIGPLGDLPDVRIDDVRIGQVLEDLVGNALKFTSYGGQICVNASLHEDHTGAILASVSDDGRGIPKEDLEKIFERFKRIESGQQLSVDIHAGIIDNLTTGEQLECEPLPEHLAAIVQAGGLMPYLQTKLETNR